MSFGGIALPLPAGGSAGRPSMLRSSAEMSSGALAIMKAILGS
eukprot:CAMPEP_0168435674 /NCGR_PEP_ID=MMETSP0228-20121227/40535_1 /TAXON_ID=133427 /ORGANISM="Protoceratium reticulatum, Strain CCCM 535 (=CCMP 1889)" /LENGTH=42 /DNA_ID= /DNA_START= /DNA_END= /DNA_ORIENTATION=